MKMLPCGDPHHPPRSQTRQNAAVGEGDTGREKGSAHPLELPAEKHAALDPALLLLRRRARHNCLQDHVAIEDFQEAAMGVGNAFPLLVRRGLPAPLRAAQRARVSVLGALARGRPGVIEP